MLSAPPFGVQHARCGREDEGSVLVGERASELEIAQHDLPHFGIGEGDFERQRIGRSVKLKSERFGFVGFHFTAHRFGEILHFHRSKAARSFWLNIELRRRFDAHKTAHQRRLRRREGEGGHWVFPALQFTLHSNDDVELREWFLAFLRAQNERPPTARLLAHAPIEQRVADYLLDVPLASDRQRQFLRFALQDVEVTSMCCRVCRDWP